MEKDRERERWEIKGIRERGKIKQDWGMKEIPRDGGREKDTKRERERENAREE